MLSPKMSATGLIGLPLGQWLALINKNKNKPNQNFMRFTRKRIGNTAHDKKGKFAASDYKITLRRKRLSNIIIMEIAVALVLFILLADLTAGFIAKSIYPIKEVNAIELDQPLQDYILEQVKANGIDPYKVYMLLHCENIDWNTEATYINSNGAGIDRGLWQINSIHHKEVSNSCSYDAKCSTTEAIRIIKDRGFSEWTCGKNLSL